MNEGTLRDQMCEIGRRLWDRGLVGACEGNISCRLDGSRFLASPAGAAKGFLSADSLVIVDGDGRPLDGGQASTEIGLHMSAYRERPDIRAAIHAHPPYATAFALAGKALPRGVLPECDIVLGQVPLVPFAVPGTAAVGDGAAPYLKGGCNAVLLAAHGAFTVGVSLEEAYNRMETVERVAQVMYLAEQLGGIKQLPPEGVAWLEHLLRTSPNHEQPTE